MTSRALLRRALVVPMLLAAFAACSDDDNGTDPGSGSFTLGAPTSTQVSLEAGTATTVTIPVTVTGNINPVTLRADSVPAGFRVGFEPATITNGTTTVTVAISADPTITAKTGTVKIVAFGEDMQDQVARIAVTSTLQPGYTAVGVEDTIRVQRGSSGTYTVNLTRSNFTGAVSAIFDSLPPGVTATYPAAATGNQITITLNAATTASAVTSSIRLRLLNPTTGDRTITVPLKVIAPPNVLIASVSPTTRSVLQGSNPTFTVNLTREGGFTGAVNISATGLPTGVTVVPTSTTTNTATLTLRVAPDAPSVTNAPITITADATGIPQRTSPVTLTIAPAQGTLITSGTPVAVPAGAANTQTLYRILIPAGATSLSVSLSGGTGDIDIVGRSGTPSVYATGGFEEISGNAGNTESFTRANPPQGFYYILAYNYEASGGATLTATVTGAEPGIIGVQRVTLTAEKATRLLGTK